MIWASTVTACVVSKRRRVRRARPAVGCYPRSGAFVYAAPSIALDPARPHRIIDIRYSFLPHRVDALWSIEVSPEAAPDAHARYRTHRADARANLGRLWRMVRGADAEP